MTESDPNDLVADKEAEMHVSFVDVGGVRTRSIVAGKGQSVVLLHGIGMSADCFHRNILALAQTHRVIALDMLGHGFTAYPGFGNDGALHSLSRHVLAYLQHEGIGPAHLVGSSLGGGMVADIALMAPEQVRSCIIVGSSTPFARPDVLGVGLSRARDNAKHSLQTGAYEALKRRLRHLVYSDEGVSEELLTMQMTIYALEDRKSAYDALVDNVVANALDTWNVPERIAEINVPTLILAGRDDPRSPLDAIERGAIHMKSARLIVYDNCGHFPFLEHPERFNRDVANFLLEVEADQIGS
ncbi:MAG: alpha/beta hydrolase [Rhizobiaceae bacterium]|nr:alpha/beta hydrolase [Rhizobiaceae bacterium]